ncbi:MAG TPA: glycosyltransferase family 2 protein [Acidimicrobiales bacterium]|jgi:N-acetylglucosaminyl-diphospho-decaprenol L-rhamnosyltransferase|nr:glycosyltransferase family 2 protein [Acidimicrobiales bacterium]
MENITSVVVSYNSATVLGPCLASLKAAGVDRIVVVDNGSTDDSRSVAGAAGAVWRDSGGNLGYGRAVNLGATDPAAGGSWALLICNPDIEVGAEAVGRLAAALEADPEMGAIGPKLVNPDGTLYPSARTFPDLVDAIGHGLFGLVFPRNRFTRRYRLLDWDHADAARVDWISGAFFLIRRRAWDSVAGFDPSYFMYMEDVDLCWRLGRAGWAVGYEPQAEVLHVQGVSANLHPYRMLAAHHRSMWRFAWRTTTGTRRLALPVVGIGLAARLAVASARHRLGPKRLVR